MIKILYIVGKLDREGGVTGFIMNYFRHIDSRFVHFDFLVFSEANSESIVEEIQSKKSQVYCIPIMERKNILEIWESLQCFFKKHENEYPIVHSHFFQLNWLLFHFARKYGAKVCISHAHATNWADYKLRAIRNRIMALPVPRCSDIWGACSIAAGEFFYGKGFLRSPKHWVIRNAIEVSRFAFNEVGRKKARQAFGYTDEFVLCNIGRMVPVKNQTFLLDIMNCLLENGQRKYRLLVVGEGELREKLIEKIERLGLNEYVTFTGMRIDIPEILWASDVFLLPSHHEGLPVSGIEAQAAGLPCVFGDAITREAAIAKVVFLSIKNGANIWADTILGIKKERIHDAADIVKKAGYDIETEGNYAAERYIDLASSADSRG